MFKTICYVIMLACVTSVIISSCAVAASTEAPLSAHEVRRRDQAEFIDLSSAAGNALCDLSGATDDPYGVFTSTDVSVIVPLPAISEPAVSAPVLSLISENQNLLYLSPIEAMAERMTTFEKIHPLLPNPENSAWDARMKPDSFLHESSAVPELSTQTFVLWGLLAIVCGKILLKYQYRPGGSLYAYNPKRSLQKTCFGKNCSTTSLTP